MKKRCAVCGDTTKMNVRLVWRRERDGKTVNVCCACAESHKVNEDSIDNYTTDDTLYIGELVQEEISSMRHYVSRSGQNHIGRKGVARCLRK